jgi:Ca2+-binding RTX toxin-like protein
MAIFDADLPANNSKLKELKILGKNPSRDDKKNVMILRKGDITIELTGIFKGTADHPLGIVTQIACFTGKDEAPTWDIAGLFLDVEFLFRKILNDKLDHVVNEIFKKKDAIAGSHFDDKLYGMGKDDEINGWRGNDLIYGGSGDDAINGYLGNDTLYGGTGRDSLKGDNGKDAFVFAEQPKWQNHDDIRDFKPGRDQIWLDQAFFSALPKGVLDEDAFVVGKDVEGPEDRIVYRPQTGQAYYDPDGTGDAPRSIFADFLKKPDLSAGDFLVI